MPFEWNFIAVMSILVSLVSAIFLYKVVTTKAAKIMNMSRGVVGFGVFLLLAVGLYGTYSSGLLGAIIPAFEPAAVAPGVAVPVGGAVCGNGICELGENYQNCPVDCSKPGEYCVDEVSLSVSSANMFSAGTALTGGGYHRLFVDSAGKWVDRGLVAEDGTEKISPKQKIRVIFGENSSAEYSQEVIAYAPCIAGTMDLEGQLCVYDTSPTTTIWLEDGSVMSSTNSQVMGASTDYTLPMRIKASNEHCAGSITHPGKGNVLCFQFNVSLFDDFVIDDAIAVSYTHLTLPTTPYV